MYRIAVIGGGQISQRRHLPEIQSCDSARVVAICSRNSETANALAKAYDCAAYTDYREMLKDKTIDAVVVATPNVLHAQMTLDALRAGKHVMCEKPMATSLEDARAMMSAAEKSGKVLFIAQNMRLAPAHVRAKAILKTGELGRVLTFRSTFGHPGCDIWAPDGKKTWFFQRGSSYFGCLGDLGIHKIDMIRWMMEDEYTEVFARVETLQKTYEDGTPIDVEDNALMLLKTKSGAMGSISASWTCAHEDSSTVFYCEKGVMTLYGDPNYQIVIRRLDGSADYINVGEIPNNVVQVKTGIIDEFVKSMRSGIASISGLDGYASLKVVFGAYESAASGCIKKLTI